MEGASQPRPAVGVIGIGGGPGVSVEQVEPCGARGFADLSVARSFAPTARPTAATVVFQTVVILFSEVPAAASVVQWNSLVVSREWFSCSVVQLFGGSVVQLFVVQWVRWFSGPAVRWFGRSVVQFSGPDLFFLLGRCAVDLTSSKNGTPLFRGGGTPIWLPSSPQLPSGFKAL